MIDFELECASSDISSKETEYKTSINVISFHSYQVCVSSDKETNYK